MSSWNLFNPYTTTQSPIAPSLEQDLRNRARAAALAHLKSNLEYLSIQLQAEQNALAHLQDRARKALDAVTAALVPYDEDQEEKVDSVYFSGKWAIEEVKKRLALQEAYDVAAALMNAKEKLVRMRRTRVECLRRELVDLGEWVGGDIEDGGSVEDEAEVEMEAEMEEVEEGRAMLSVGAEDRPAFSVEKGQSAARKRFHSFGQTRPPLVRRHVRRHAAVPWSVSWDM